MIPKKIHYCWFGGNPLPKTALKCIDSWKTYLPDFEIKEWNEQNFDVMMNDYTRYCYENKRWAFLSDYARLWVVAHEGGVYFDVDVEVVRSLSSVEEFKTCGVVSSTVEDQDECQVDGNVSAFFGWELPNYVNTGIGFGAVAGHPALKEMMKVYEDRTQEMLEKEWVDRGILIGCPTINTKVFEERGLVRDCSMQTCFQSLILPPDYMCPYNDVTGELKKTKNTISIHWGMKSALPLFTRLKSKITRPLHRLFGTDCLSWLKRK